MPPEEAADATTDALSRCRRDWGRASREEDVDALVQAELLLAARRRPRTRGGGPGPAGRELLVLAPPTLEELRHQESLNNRATLRRAALVAVPLLLVGVGVGVYLGTTGDDGKPATDDGVLENAAISQEENPAPGVVWYADGQLHLDHTVLAVEGLKDMTRIGTGVVYGDDQGRVVYAADDGSREVLGHKDPEVPVAATDETGWAAWVETGGDQTKLVVKEATTGNDVASAVVDAGAQVVAVDGDTVYYVDVAGAHELHPGGNTAVETVTPRDLRDVRSRIRAFQVDEDTIEVVQSFFGVEFQLPGLGAALSPDGNLVATRLPGTRPGRALRHPLRPGAPERRTRRRPRGHVRAGLPAHGDLRRRARRPVTRTGARAPHLRAHRHCRVRRRRPDPQPGRYAGAGTLRAWETLTSSARSTSSAPAR